MAFVEAEIFFLLISRLYWDSSSKLNVLYVRRSAPKVLHLPRRQSLVALTLLSEGDPVVRVLQLFSGSALVEFQRPLLGMTGAMGSRLGSGQAQFGSRSKRIVLAAPRALPDRCRTPYHFYYEL